ncbi:TatD family hydrolase [Microaerobacter geothermalis]|uniref:TatD family hydrolase n=1 Tax=Microaerobacter geothermalis TaxID=674972 RepID=UPI001F26D155|nr:TatD family hydrolase [Microaerobacter geothermalis]MCF6095151.1 TatD family hydrolase [Microaerobacter geothermalis]
MLFDTHAHLNDEKFNDDRDEVIQRALDNGVRYIVNIGYNRETIPSCLELAETFPFIYAALGWHPTEAKEMNEEDLDWLRNLMTHDKVVAVGEIGLDYYWDYSPQDIQKEVFRKQIALAKEVKKPIVIHNRDAHQDIVDILKEEKAYEVGGIMHCFSGSWEIAKMCMDMNFYISFGGPITFKNARKLKEVVKEIPLDRLLIETDCPYLTPEPYRGKRNETAYVKYVAEGMAQLKGVEYEELAKVTMENAKKIFHIR